MSLINTVNVEDRKFILKVLKREDCLDIYLDIAPSWVKRDKKIIISLIKNRRMYRNSFNFYPSLLQHIDMSLRNDEDVVFAALKKNAEEFLYVGSELKNNRQFIIRAINKKPDIFPYLPEKFKNDVEIVNIAINKEFRIYHLLSDDLKNNFNILSVYINSFEFCDTEFEDVKFKNKKYRYLTISEEGIEYILSRKKVFETMKLERELLATMPINTKKGKATKF